MLHLFGEEVVQLYTMDGPFCFRVKSLKRCLPTSLEILVLFFATAYFWVDADGHKHYVQDLFVKHGPNYCVGQIRNSEEILRDPSVREDRRQLVLETDNRWLWVQNPNGTVFSLEEGSEVISDAAGLILSRR